MLAFGNEQLSNNITSKKDRCVGIETEVTAGMILKYFSLSIAVDMNNYARFLNHIFHLVAFWFLYHSCQDSEASCPLFDVEVANHGCFSGFAIEGTFQLCRKAVFFHQKYTHGKLFPYIGLQNIKY